MRPGGGRVETRGTTDGPRVLTRAACRSRRGVRRPDGDDKIIGVTHAVVLIRAERSALPTLGSELAALDGVAEAYSVTGEWDFVAVLRVASPDALADVVTARLARLDGIERTYTMVAFEAFSKHDLEAMFSIGA